MADRVRFKQADVTRAIKAAQTAGKHVTRVRIAPDGAIELDFTMPQPTRGQPDDWLESWLISDEVQESGPQ